MGSLWEPYGKGVPFFGAPGNSLDPLVDGSLLMFFKKHFVKHQVDGTLGVGLFLYSGFILSLH